jgi:hypothetical protein
VAFDVFADLSSASFVASSKGGSDYSFLDPFQYDKMYLRVQPLELTLDGAQTQNPYETLDAAAYAITAIVVTTGGTTLAGPTVISTPDGTAATGSIDLNTAATATAMSGQSSISAYLQMSFDDGANRKVTIQTTLTIKKSYLTGSTPSELPLTTYLTRDECIALFVKFAGNPNGSTVTLPSDSGAYKVILGANDDGSFRADIEQ